MLVIIALTVGGIVGGKSLIEAAKINTLINESQRYRTAYNTFMLQYDALPGDFSEGYDYFSNGSSSTCGAASGSSSTHAMAIT